MMKCELCKVRASIFCESDQANLCWTCDANVHSANFLVARHSRTLLCRACNSLTPWKATGAVLANAVSFCNRCGDRDQEEEEDEESEGGNDVVETDTEDEEDEEDSNNQVVPWSPTTPPPLPEASSSGSDESVNGDGMTPTTTATSLKRQRDDCASDRDFKEGLNGSVYQQRCGGEWRDEVAERDEEPPFKGWLS